MTGWTSPRPVRTIIDWHGAASYGAAAVDRYDQLQDDGEVIAVIIIDYHGL